MMYGLGTRPMASQDGDVEPCGRSVRYGGALCIPSLAAAAALIVFVQAVAAAADYPYPQSDLVTGISWDLATHRDGGSNGDIWPVAWGADGQLYTAWGDGLRAGCSGKVSYSTAVITGGPGSAGILTRSCGPQGSNQGKLASLADVDGTLYALANLQNGHWPDVDHAIWSSPDGGKTWNRPGWVFGKGPLHPSAFVGYGPGYSGAKDGYVYLTALRSVPDDKLKSFYLMRVARDALGRRDAYEYLSDVGGGVPAWTKDPGRARAVFNDSRGVDSPILVHDKQLGRYLLTVTHGHAGQLGIFEGREPWGPWQTVDYTDDWLGLRGGHLTGLSLPAKWMEAGGQSLWGVFSCGGDRLSCGDFYDRYNVVQATLQLAAERHAAAAQTHVRGLVLAHRTRVMRDTDTDRTLTAGLASLDEQARLGLNAFPVGLAALPDAADPGDPSHADFSAAYAPARHDGGAAFTYGLSGGTTLAFTITDYGDRDASSAGRWTGTNSSLASRAVSFALDHRWGAIEFETRLAYARNKHERVEHDRLGGTSDSASFDGQTTDVSQRLGYAIRRGGLVVTPWTEMSYTAQRADGYTLRSSYLPDQSYAPTETADILGSVGLDARLDPIALGTQGWLSLRGGVSYTHGLAEDDYRVSFQEAGVDTSEAVERAVTRTLGAQLGVGLELGSALSLDASLSLEQDLAGSPSPDVTQAGRFTLTWRF